MDFVNFLYHEVGIRFEDARKNQTEKVQSAKHSTVGVNMPAITSA